MKYILSAALALLIAYHGLSQSSPNHTFGAYGGAAVPLGKFSKRAGYEHPLGFATTGFAGKLIFDTHVSQNLILSITALTTFNEIDNNLKMEEVLDFGVQKSEYFIAKKYDYSSYIYYSNALSFGLKRPFVFKRWHIEPCISVGLGLFGSDFEGDFFVKKKGDNFFKNTHIEFIGPDKISFVLSPSISFNYDLTADFGFGLSCNYWQLKGHEKYKVSSTDIFGEKDDFTRKTSISVALLDLNFGVYGRF